MRKEELLSEVVKCAELYDKKLKESYCMVGRLLYADEWGTIQNTLKNYCLPRPRGAVSV